MPCPFFRGLSGFLFMLLRLQFKAWFGIGLVRPYHVLISSSFAIPALKCYSVSNFWSRNNPKTRDEAEITREFESRIFLLMEFKKNANKRM